MNFTFSDVSSSYLNMVQQDLPKGIIPDADASGFRNQSFAEKLTETIDRAERLKERPLVQKPQDPAMEDAGTMAEFLSKKLDKEKGVGFVSALKVNFLMLSNGDLKNLSIDADGLEALEKILRKAGFKKEDVDDLMAGLLEEVETKTLTLDDFFDRLFDLSLDAEATADAGHENFIETSASPFIESLLNSLDLPRDDIQGILSEADKGDKGISLDVVIDRLQGFQKKSFYTGEQYKTREGDNNYRQLFQQMGLGPIDDTSSVLDLDELVRSLEGLRKKISQQNETAGLAGTIGQKQTNNEKSIDIFNALFKGIELENEAKAPQPFKFSSDQIKDQFKNGLTTAEDGKTDKNILQAAGQKETDGVKQIESLLGAKRKGTADMNDPSKENKGFLKQLKSETAKLSDQSQISASDGKTNETQSNINGLKTKASFKSLPNYVTQQVGKSLVRAVNQGENTLTLQLKPAELGRLVMTIENTGTSMKVSIVTENIAAKEILASNVNELRSVLSSSGVNLERFDVDMNSNFRQSMADARGQTGNFGKRHQNREKVIADPINGRRGNDLTTDFLDAATQSGSLHFVA